jgi:hypothetical protein
MVGEVGKHNAGTSACFCNRSCKSLGIFARIVCVQDDSIACAGQHERDGRADAATSAGDERRARRFFCDVVRHPSNPYRLFYLLAPRAATAPVTHGFAVICGQGGSMVNKS